MLPVATPSWRLPGLRQVYHSHKFKSGEGENCGNDQGVYDTAQKNHCQDEGDANGCCG